MQLASVVLAGVVIVSAPLAAPDPTSAAGLPIRAVAATAGLSAATTGVTQAAVPDVTVHPAGLERGPNTGRLHLQEEVIVDGDLRIPLRGPAHVWLMGRIGRDYLVTAASVDFERYAVQVVKPNGDRRVVQRFGDETTATMSGNGRRLALTTPVKRDTQISVVQTRSGALVRLRTFDAEGAEVSDYGTRRMVLTGIRSARTSWWNPVSNRLTLIVPRPASADIEADRLVVLTPNPQDPYGSCQRTVRLSRPKHLLWNSCRNIPLSFSPDARRMLTVDIRADGIGPGTIQVRKQGGTLVRTYRAPMWFGFTEWESNRDLLLQPVGRRFVAAVRCAVSDGCERASRLYSTTGTYDPPETMRWSFPQ